MNPLIPLWVIVPLASAFLIVLLGKLSGETPKYFTPLVMLFLLVTSLDALIHSGYKITVYEVGGWNPVNSIPIGIYMVYDGISALMLCVISTIGFLSAVYSLSYMDRYTGVHYYYALFCLMVGGMNGVVLSGDLFNIFVFLEISVIASYALVAFGVEKNELEASLKYQVLGGIASFLILFGIGLIYWKVKTLNLADIREAFKIGYDKSYYLFIQLLILSGFGLKAAIMPFHAWLPDAHSSAPSPVSAMLSGVFIKAVGIYVIIRLFFTMFALSEPVAVLITVLGTISMVAGVFLAVGQWDIKRLLAYHSISQMGYVILGTGSGMILLSRGIKPEVAALAITGGLFHLINHAAFKGLLFLNAGAIEYRLGTRNLKEMGGLSSTMPVTSATSFVASLSISGIPPFNGFFSKLIIVVACVRAGFYLLAILAIIVSIITLASFLKLQRYAFYSKTQNNPQHQIKEVPGPMIFSMIMLAILCLIMSVVAFPLLRESILKPAVDILMDPNAYSLKILGK